MKCRVYECWREAAEGSEFCRVKHGWQEIPEEEYAPKPPPKTQPKKAWTRELIVVAIQRWAKEHGRAPTQEDWALSAAYRPTTRTVRVQFGTWSAALAAAGFVRRPGRPLGAEVPAA